MYIEGGKMRKLLNIFLALAILLMPVLASEDTDLGQPIIGPPTTNVGRMRAWAISQGADQEFVDQAENFYRISVDHGVDPAVTYAQSAKETNYFKFTGVLTNEFKNPCGLKTSEGGGNYDPKAHQVFESWEEGITAQVHHLALYAGGAGFPKDDTPDPRHFGSIRARAPKAEDLGGKWAPSPKYGVEIVDIMRSFADVTSTFVYVEPEPQIIEDEKEALDPMVGERLVANDLDLSGETNVILETPMERVFGSTRQGTSIEISKRIKSNPTRLILASGGEFTSALLASSISYTGGSYSPILLAGPEIDQAIVNEIDRIGPREVFVIGSPSQISPNYDSLLKSRGVVFRRFTGANRYDTANIIASLTNSKEFILVNGGNFADALTISALAARESKPILFTDGKTLDESTKARLAGGDKVYIIGGNNSVSPGIEKDLKKATQVERISGPNRYHTAIAISKRFYDSRRFIIANGDNFPDSLAGSSLAGYYKAPLLLTGGEALNEDLNAFLRGEEVENIIVLGGNKSISPGVYTDLSGLIR